MWATRKTVLVLLFLVVLPSILSAEIEKVSRAPDEWATRVVLGENILKRDIWWEVPIGEVSEIRVKTEGSLLRQIIAVGRRGAIYKSPEGRITREISFDSWGGRVITTDIDGDGKEEFLNRGGGWQRVSLYNSEGKTIWSYEGGKGLMDYMLGHRPNDLAVGDVDGDGKIEFVVGLNGSGGILLLDMSGQIIWRKKESNVWAVEILDLDDDGKGEIIHTNMNGRLTIRNERGEIIRFVKTHYYISRLSQCAWPHDGLPLQFIGVRRTAKKFFLLNIMGEITKEFGAPWAATSKARCVPVRFNKEMDAYLAVVNQVKTSWRRSVLYIYDPMGKLIYQEVIPAAMATLAALPPASGKRGALLVGGESVIWRYSLKAK